MKQTNRLTEGDVVLTTQVIAEDFTLPVVARPSYKRDQRIPRVVRSVVGGVVRFTDGTKSHPQHGRASWELAEG